MAPREGLTLISALPSPYARKVAIYLHEKGLSFVLQTEVPWDSTTTVPMHNPLEKLPVLILPNGCSVYESHHILEYLELKYPNTPPMLPDLTDVNGLDEVLFAKKIEVISDGICDALVLMFFERQRPESCRSKEWEARQMRKVDGGVQALAEYLPCEKNGDTNGNLSGVSGGQKSERFFIGDRFGLADVAAGCVLGYLDVRFPEYLWRDRYPDLASYADSLNQRESFKKTIPMPQTIQDKIV